MTETPDRSEEEVEEEYTVRVVDDYEDREETYMARVGTETVSEWKDQPV